MNQKMKRWKAPVTFFLTLILVLQGLTGGTLAAAAVHEQFKVSGGVNYQDMRIEQNGNPQAVRVMEVDVNDPYTTVEVGVPNPLNKLSRTTSQALERSQDGHQVVGAINGSFFSQDRLPMYLISLNNRLVNAGIIASGNDQYVNVPIAFGMDQSGKGKIDYYNLDLSFVHNGIEHVITSTNKQRSPDSLILYTPEFPGGYTNTNENGKEVVVSGLDKTLDLEFGETYSGKVEAIRLHGEKGNTKIPENGFVLSAHGDSLQALKDINIGDTIELSANIDSKWQNSEFMLAGGPLLVKDGKVNLTMDPDSYRAAEKAPRTAVAVDKTGEKVYFITVDGRQNGYSRGMNLQEFAEYLADLGVDSALNLDGGGSTTMAARFPGDFDLKLANQPSDGTERAVSTILMAVSTAPKGTAASMIAKKSAEGALLKGAKISVSAAVFDQYYNPVKISASDIQVTDTNKLGTVSGTTFTAVKAGTGSLAVKVGNAVQNLPIQVVEDVSKLTVSPSSVQVGNGEEVQLKATGLDAKGDPVIMGDTSVQWSVSGNIGTISKTGLFKAASQPANGSIIAQYGTKKVTIPVKVGGGAQVLDSFDTIDNWSVTNTRAASSISLSQEAKYTGTGSLALKYDFTTGGSGTAASYLNAKTPISIDGKPASISLRVFGDSNKQWLRGKVTDGNGAEHIINFTEAGGMTWKGWKYVSADIPKEWPAPLTIDQIYMAQPTESLKSAGTIYVDQLQAIYGNSYEEPLFNDVGLNYWAKEEVSYLIDRGVISGYADGTFKPNVTLNRVQAAIMLQRALNLDTESVKDPGYQDVPKTYSFYDSIAAVSEAGIMKGKAGGTKFDPYAQLTRAEMAVILQRALKLPEATKNYFTDNHTGSFAYQAVNAMAASNITTGYSDGTYRPANPLTRTEFSVFLYRGLK